MEQECKKKIMKAIDEILPELTDISKSLYENPEIGGTENKSVKLLDPQLLQEIKEEFQNSDPMPFDTLQDLC